MKLAQAFSHDKVVSTEGIPLTKAFGMAKEAQKMVFSIFTKSLYSNPIGSIVREITSNCFDSHKEANVDSEVKIIFKKENNQYYICFQDFGVGMSYERVTTVFAEYFNSTKRDSDDQIGGFGIGGKTPLAYSESFFLITNFDKTQYVWCIYKGEDSPMIDLLSSVPTTERNGTTVKVPIMSGDYSKFEYEMNRQLYYFENVIFESFSGLDNDYSIYRGQHFLYRGHTYSSRMHICLGRVAYPIDYSVLALLENEHAVPVALRFEIGEVEVTPSRETIQYTESTIKTIKKKIELAKEELRSMILKQYKNISSLEEYYTVKKSFGSLIIDKEKDISINLRSFIKGEDLVYPKLDRLTIPSTESLSRFLIDHELKGRKKKKESSWNKDLDTMAQWQNIYFLENGVKKNRRIQSYLKFMHPHYHFIYPDETLTDDTLLNHYEDIVLNGKSVGEMDGEDYNHLSGFKFTVMSSQQKVTKESFKQMRMLINEGIELFRTRAKAYSAIIVRNDFVITRNSHFGKEMYEKKMNTMFMRSGYSTARQPISFKDMMEFKGTLIYGAFNQSEEIRRSIKLLKSLGLIRTATKSLFLNRYEETVHGVGLNKMACEHIKNLKNAVHFEEVYNKFIYRKRQAIIQALENDAFIARFNNLSSLFFNKTLIGIDKTLKVHTHILTEAKNKASNRTIDLSFVDLEKLKIDRRKIVSPKQFEKHFKYLEDLAAKNRLIKYVSIPHWTDASKDADLMELIKLVYVK